MQFAKNVSFDGQQTSATSNTPTHGDRPGSTPCEIEFDPESMCFSLTKIIKGVVRTKFVHVSNVTGWEVLPEAPKKPEVKK